MKIDRRRFLSLALAMSAPACIHVIEEEEPANSAGSEVALTETQPRAAPCQVGADGRCLGTTTSPTDECTGWDPSGECVAWNDQSYAQPADECIDWDPSGECVRWGNWENAPVDECVQWDPSGECVGWEPREHYEPVAECVQWDPSGECIQFT